MVRSRGTLWNLREPETDPCRRCNDPALSNRIPSICNPFCSIWGLSPPSSLAPKAMPLTSPPHSHAPDTLRLRLVSRHTFLEVKHASLIHDLTIDDQIDALLTPATYLWVRQNSSQPSLSSNLRQVKVWVALKEVLSMTCGPWT